MEELVGSLNTGGELRHTLFRALSFLVSLYIVVPTVLFLHNRSKTLYIPSTFQTKFYQSHRVDEREIKPGDHIYTWTPLFIYSHHGICVDENIVIHFTGAEDGISASSDSLFSRSWPSKPIPVAKCDLVSGCGERHGSGVVRSCITCFKERRYLYRYQYGLGTFEYMLKLRNGTSTMAFSDQTSEVIDRANQLLKTGFGIYNVLFNNCEDFSLYCKTSYTLRRRAGGSKQVTSSFWLLSFVFVLDFFSKSPRVIFWFPLIFAQFFFYRFLDLSGEVHNLRYNVKTEVKDLGAWRNNYM